MTNSYKISFLCAADIPQSLSLQTDVLAALPPGDAHHLRFRGAGEISAHLSARMPFIGAVENGMLIGQVMVTLPAYEENNERINGYPIQHPSTTAIIQSLAISPHKQGNGVGNALLETAFEAAAMRGCVQLIAKVSTGNTASRASFEKAGFSVMAEGVDPKKGYPVIYMHRTL